MTLFKAYLIGLVHPFPNENGWKVDRLFWLIQYDKGYVSWR